MSGEKFRARAWVLALLVAVAMSGCSGGCSALAPLSAPLPRDQTVEGGVQIRVTPSGFNTLTSVLPGIVDDSIKDGFCIGKLGPWDLEIADVDACYQADCAGGKVGCKVSVSLDALHMSVPDPQTFRVEAIFDVSAPIKARADWIIGGASTCTLNVTLNNGRVVADIGFGIDPPTGELTVKLKSIKTFDISNLGLSGCGVLGDILDAFIGLVADIVSSSLGNFIINALTPVIDGFLQDLLPKPLGVEGVVDLGNFIPGVSSDVDPLLEVRAVAGGYVSLPAQGLSVGLITAFNADRDPSTRDPGRASQAALCVPDRPAPDYSGLLPKEPTRGTFTLKPAQEFLGMPDPAADLAIGVSETALDLLGHHVVSSGAMCIGVGSSLVPQLNLGTVGILVPSLAELGDGTGKEPILLVVRPQRPLDFTVGDGTDTSPRLTIGIRDLDIDFYAFLYERYVRAFTITLEMDVGLNLDFTLDDQGKPAILPTIIGLDANSIGVTVYNAEFLAEDAKDLEQVFPTLFNLILPIVSEGLGAFALPEISGFQLDNLQITKVTTSEDEFLAIYASLAAGSGKRAEIEKSRRWLKDHKPVRAITAYTPVETTARVVRVTTPAPERIRAAIKGLPGGALPEIELELGGSLERGLEWQWSLDGGLWRPFSPEARPVLSDPAFAVQGRHTLFVRARAKDDYRTFDRTPVELPVVIDSVGPTILVDRLVRERDAIVIPASDLVTADEAIEFAFGAIPTAWQRGGRLPLADLESLADADGTIHVWARDELGNASHATVDVSALIAFHGRVPSEGGCGCHVTGRAHSHDGGLGAALLGVALVALFALRRRLWTLARAALRRRWALHAALALAASLTPGCNCGDTPTGDSCSVDADCAASCGAGKVPLCIDGMCHCADDIPVGRIGRYSDLATTPDGRAYVSAYNETHGDLMVAEVLESGRIPDEDWVFVDGVPEGPVVLPQSDVRGGIKAAGEDVGLYTSIAAAPNGDLYVSYFDATTSSLKFAGRFGGDWRTMIVDKGAPITDPELGGEDTGRYSAISVSLADGRPAIAYMATVFEGSGIGRTELRFARARLPQPFATSDWDLWIVDQAPIPPMEPDQPAPVELPEGVGLFVAMARLSDGAPILAYYDRQNGDLKVAVFDQGNNIFKDPEIVDGADGSDVGWYPSVAVSPDDTVHISYVDAGRDNLLYVNLRDRVPEIVDDGYRIDGTTPDGLPRPVYHFVGDDSGIVATGSVLAVAYQDATGHELVLATRDPATSAWNRETIAGAEEPFRGAYGFYAAAKLGGQHIIMSSFVVNQKEYDAWVEVFRANTIVQ